MFKVTTKVQNFVLFVHFLTAKLFVSKLYRVIYHYGLCLLGVVCCKCCSCFRIEEIMRWQFEVEEGADDSVAGRIVWTVDYEKNGLSRNSYFPPQDSRISAKITILGEHPESIVTVFKVRASCLWNLSSSSSPSIA